MSDTIWKCQIIYIYLQYIKSIKQTYDYDRQDKEQGEKNDFQAHTAPVFDA